MYNLTDGGDGGSFTEEARQRLSEQRKGKRFHDDAHYERLAALMRALWQDHKLKGDWVRRGRHLSDETKKKISEATKDREFSDEHRAKLSEARRKRVTKDETRAKISNTLKGHINIKQYRVIAPDGTVYTTTNGMVRFCEEHSLTPSLMHFTISGKRRSHKGWRAERLDKNNEIG